MGRRSETAGGSASAFPGVAAPPTRATAAWARGLAAIGVLAACGVFLFLGANDVPIVIWDESRLAVNALEMHLRGFSLVTTYGFAPDLWNTKPPLLIWLMTAVMDLFGPTEWAVRAPSYLAAMGTLALVMDFTRRMTRSLAAGAAAAVLLTLSLGFFGEHGARTGDYDALLCFFTTAYLLLLFFAVHQRRPRAWRILLAGGLVAAAVLTKSIAGLVPGVGLAAYLLVCGRWRRPLQSPWYGLAALIAAAPTAAFYLLREAQAPGYLAAVWTNDVSGRFMTALDRHAGPPWYYLKTTFLTGLFSAGMWTLAAPLALFGIRGVARQGLIFALCCAGGVLATVSLSSTKLPQYALTAYPFLAIAVAVAGHHLWTRLQAHRGDRPIGVLAVKATLAAAALVLAAKACWFRFDYLPTRQFYPQAAYGQLLASLADQGARRVVLVEKGAPGLGLDPGYAPQLRFYALLAGRRGLDVRQTMVVPALADLAPGAVLGSCDPRVAPGLRAVGRDVGGVAGCVAIRGGG